MKITLKKSLTIGVLSFLFLVFLGCGDSNNESKTDNSSNTKEEQPADDGEGIGRFKNVSLGSIDASMAAAGKVIFDAKCAACHRMTDQKIVGPGLKGITKLRKPSWILNMITNPEEMTKNDPEARKLLEEHLTQMTFQNVSDDEARQMLEYFRENDENGAAAQN